jgi:hypothetical protein
MIPKYVKTSDGTLIRDRGAWAANALYSIWNVVTESGIVYRCKLGHVATSANKPGTGASWTTCWDVFGPAGNSRGFSLLFYEGGTVLTTGVKYACEFPLACRITNGKIASVNNTVGSLHVALWKCAYADLPPTPGSHNTIKTFVLSSAVKSSENTVNLNINAGDWLFFNVDYVVDITMAAFSVTLV